MSKFWMVRRVTILLLGQISGVLYAQNTALTTQIDYLIDKSDSFTYIKIDSALFYANAILKLGEQNHDATTTFRGYRTVASVYEENSRFAEAQAVYKKALDLAESQLSDFQKCTIYTDWAIIHKKMGQYLVTQDYHQRTIEKAQKINNWELVENGYNGLGTLQALLGDYEKAIQNYQKSIEAAEKWGNKTGVVLTYENIICLYLNTKNFLEAQKMVEKTRKIASTLGDEARIAAVLNLEGNIDLALGRPYTALAKFKKVKDIFEKKGDKAQLCRTFLTIGNLYFEQKNNAEANEYFNQCLQNVDFLSPVCSAELYSKLGGCHSFVKCRNRHRVAQSVCQQEVLIGFFGLFVFVKQIGKGEMIVAAQFHQT